MVTALIARGYAQGADSCIVGWLICATLYMITCFAFQCNRKNPQSVILAFLLAEFIVDIIWAVVYFGPNGYINHGIGAVLWLVLWPISLFLAGLIPTVGNKLKSQRNY